MDITLQRVSRYLLLLKKVSNYLFKLREPKFRDGNKRVVKTLTLLLQAEDELRDLQKLLTEKGK